MTLSPYRMHKIYLAATMNYGLGTSNSEELAYFKIIKEKIHDMKKASVKKGIPLILNSQKI